MPHPQSTVLWLFGPAGVGKPAIMQTLARQLQDAGRLDGSFFFKRGHATRGNAKTLFATIAYQLALSVPSLRMRISQIMLISDHCRKHANRDSVTILIDGLDECEGQDTQIEILRAIRNACNPSNPLRFIVASRPEEHIREMFHSPFYSGCYHPVNVEQSFEDVRKYLRDEFTRIHREHRTMASVPHPWPSPDLLDDLVKKSSGYFVYAATIIKFFDDKSHRPTRRLAIIIDGRQESESAFDILDQLYRTILSSAPRQAELGLVLCAIINFNFSLDHLDQLFGLEGGEARLILGGLHSVLFLPERNGGQWRIPSAPQDLIKMWEDYFFMYTLVGDATACSVKYIPSPTSEFCKVLVATVFTGMWLWDVRRLLLDIGWTEFRTILCCIQPNIASDREQVLHGFPKDIVRALVPPQMQQATFRELASNWIYRVIKSHVHDGVHDREAWLVP
ncbi:hypothetical protein C8R45DRAFT_1139094 [Mycena sanguinolenta]|nr:hypothetical protein C8R45DRAFT_1139094 [Mycena sanguinolenta]